MTSQVANLAINAHVFIQLCKEAVCNQQKQLKLFFLLFTLCFLNDIINDVIQMTSQMTNRVKAQI